jgi:hypothetical protein
VIAFRSETRTTDNGARVEVGTVTHEGRDFAALGSMVDEASGLVCAYVTERPDPAYRDGKRYVLTTWEGVELAPLRLVRTWQQQCYGGRTRIYAWSAVVQGRTYSGRNSGPTMIVRMRTKP